MKLPVLKEAVCLRRNLVECKMKFVIFLSLFLYSGVQNEEQNDNILSASFDVKPDDRETVYEKDWDKYKYKCTFTYKAQGGTKEQWQSIMERLEDGKMLRCTVSRGTSSYLHFENFTMSLTGPNVHLKEYDATSYMEKRLKDFEIKMKKKNKTIYSVPGKFENRLERVTLTAKIYKKKPKKVEL